MLVGVLVRVYGTVPDRACTPAVHPMFIARRPPAGCRNSAPHRDVDGEAMFGRDAVTIGKSRET
jgi:hypothetical protein